MKHHLQHFGNNKRIGNEKKWELLTEVNSKIEMPIYTKGEFEQRIYIER